MNDVLFNVIYATLVFMILMTIYCLFFISNKKKERKRTGPTLWEFYRNMRHEREKELEDLEEEY